jgi:chemotaxis protein CheD
LRSRIPTASAKPESTDYLYPGQLFTSPEPSAVMTILGSCVAVCLWDAQAGVGGVSHYLLPNGIGKGMSAHRYGSLAIPELIRRILAIGARPNALQAKIFGGACLNIHGESHLSAENIAIARTYLAEAKIAILAEDVGGSSGRKLIFRIPDGEAWVKTV